MRIINKLLSLFNTKQENEIYNDKEKVNDISLLSRINIHKEKLSIKELVERDNSNKFYAIDFETTGLSIENDRIIEIGLVKFENNKITNQFKTFVNPGFSIPKEASAINKITDDMVKHAPMEKEAIDIMLEFLKSMSNEEIVFCAHNADFDINFLMSALNRCRVSMKLTYVDTLKESRNLVPGLNNYKLATVANHFSIINAKSHRANEDAMVSGLILIKLIDKYLKDNAEKIKLEKEQMAKRKPKDKELVICASITRIISETGYDLSLLRFYRDSSNYIKVSFFYTMFKFKFAKKGRYIIMPKDEAIISGLPTENATMSEGGTEYLRTFFNSPKDINKIQNFIINSYLESYRSYCDFKKYSEGTRYYIEGLNDYKKSGIQLNIEDAKFILEQSEDLPSVLDLNINIEDQKQIDTSKIEIKPVNNRVPLAKIQNIDDWDRGFNLGFPLWEKGDVLRKDNKLEEAIDLFDKARYRGYNAPALYWSYALAYRKLKDYDNEIDILDEAIARLFPDKCDGYSKFSGRRQRALELLAKKKN